MWKNILLTACLMVSAGAYAETPAASRPAMPDLFFTQEQRKQLEILRSNELAELDIHPEFIPILFPQEINTLTPDALPETAPLRTGAELIFNAYIINNTTGGADLLA